MGLLPQGLKDKLGEVLAVVMDRPLPAKSLPVSAPRNTLPARLPEDDDDQDTQIVGEYYEDDDDDDDDQREYDKYRQRIYAQTTHMSAGAHGVLRRWWVKAAQAGLAVICWVILSLGNAQLFAGFQPWNTSWLTVLAYIAGFGYEFAGMALIFVAGMRFEQKKWGQFWAALSGAVFMALVSFLTQYLFVSVDVASLHLPAIVLSGIPGIVNAIKILRSLVPAVLEFYLVFLVAEKTASIEDTIAQQRKERQGIHQLMIEDERAQQEHMATKAMSALMRAGTDAMEQSAALLVDNQQLLMQEMRPKMIVQHIHHDAEPPAPASSPAPTQPARPLQSPEQLADAMLPRPQPDAFTPVDYTNVGKRPPAVPPTQPRPVQQARPAAVPPPAPRPTPAKTVPLSSDEEKIRYAQMHLARYNSIDDAAKALSAKYGGESQARFWLLKAQTVQKPLPSNGHTPADADDLSLDNPLPFL